MAPKRPYAFVSYSHADSDIVMAEVSSLRDHGLAAYYDNDFESTADWQGDVEQSIENSDAMIFYVSPMSVESPNCKQELLYAREHSLPILLYYIAESEVPLGWQFSARQIFYPHRGDPHGQRERLMLRLATYLGSSDRSGHTYLGPGDKIVVLPIVNNSTDLLDDFAQRLAVDIYTLLDFQPSFQLISRKSLFIRDTGGDSPAELGSKLGADSVITGTLDADENRANVRAHIEVIRCSTGVSQLQRTFVLGDQSVANFRLEIGETVARSLAAVTTAAQPGMRTNSEEAFAAYVRGQAFWYKQDYNSLLLGIGCYKQALEFDPDYADAHIALIKAYIDTHSVGADRTWVIEQATAAIDAAASRRHHDEGATPLDLCSAYFDRLEKWTVGLAAEEATAREIIIANPSAYNAFAEYGEGVLLLSGFYHEAIDYLLVAEAHDPQNWAIKRSLALSFGCIDEAASALQRLQQILDDDPNDRLSLVYRAFLHIRQKNGIAARNDIEQIEEAEADKLILRLINVVFDFEFRDEAQALRDFEKVLSETPTDRETPFPFLIGLTCLVLDRYDDAFRYWDKANQQRDRLLHHIKPHMAFFCSTQTIDHVVDDLRYKNLIEGIGLDENWSRQLTNNVASLTPVTGIRVHAAIND